MGLFDEVATKGQADLGFFGRSPLGQIGDKALNIGINAARSRMTDKLPLVDGALQLARGGFSVGNVASVIGTVVNSAMLNRYLPFQQSNPQINHWFSRSELRAKLSLEEHKRLIQLSYAINHARKNLWLISIEPYNISTISSLSSMISSAVGNKVGAMIGGNNGNAIGKVVGDITQNAINTLPLVNELSDQGGGIHSTFNMLATEVNYSPISLEGDQYSIGSAVVDGVKSAQPVEISITTMDDEQGTIKRFFKQKASEIIHPDGTVGVLADGLVKIRILHAFVNDATNHNGFEETMICRPISIEYDFSRREEAMSEFTMRFIQTDTFLR